jgi:hypothetical protein
VVADGFGEVGVGVRADQTSLSEESEEVASTVGMDSQRTSYIFGCHLLFYHLIYISWAASL